MELRRIPVVARGLTRRLDRREGAGATLALLLTALLVARAEAKKGGKGHGGKGHGGKKHKHRKKHRGGQGAGRRTCDDIALQPGADLHNCDLRQHPGLASADFTDARLEDSDLSGAALPGVSFRGARLWRASLIGANLTGARFEPSAAGKTDLYGADFTDANLTGANYDADQVYYARYAVFCRTAMPDGTVTGCAGDGG